MTKRPWPSQGCGAGLRNKHYPFILEKWPKMDWFEAVTENFMDTGGRPLATLEKVRAHYPVALHGVALSIGSTDPLDKDYLQKLKTLAKHIDPFVISDHLCWTGVDGVNLHDLLPLPFTEEALEHVVRRTEEVQAFLGRPILLENVSTYVTYKHSTMPEWEFLREVARRSGCGILLDLNNIYVNSVNHRFDAAKYLEEIPGEQVGQFHLAGHTDKGPFLFDTHSSTVADEVWKLYRRALELYGPVSTLIEWDEAIPDFSKLDEEVQKARAIYDAVKRVPRTLGVDRVTVVGTVGPTLLKVQRQMKERIRSHNHTTLGEVELNEQGGARGEERMAVYAEAYVARLMEALAEIYETVYHLLGKEAFIELTESYLEAHPSHSYNLNSFGEAMAPHLERTRFAAELPFLPDLARLEWQVSRAFHSFEQTAFDPASIAQNSEEDWDRLRVVFQPSVAVIRSQWPILTIWNARKKPLGEIDISLEGQPQQVLVSRRGMDVTCEALEEAQVELILSLQSGEPLGKSCARLAERAGAEEWPMGEWFSSWASRGLIARVA